MDTLIQDVEEIDVEIGTPLFSGLWAFALDKYYLQERDNQKSMMFGAGVAVGVGAGAILGTYLPSPNFDLGFLASGKSMEKRIMEIGLGAGSAYALNEYVLKSTPNRTDMMNKLGVIVASTFLGNWTQEIVSQTPITII